MPSIVISASGMATGGRVLHHLKAALPDPRNTVLFAGFQADGHPRPSPRRRRKASRSTARSCRSTPASRSSTRCRRTRTRRRSCGGSVVSRRRRSARSSCTASRRRCRRSAKADRARRFSWQTHATRLEETVQVHRSVDLDVKTDRSICSSGWTRRPSSRSTPTASTSCRSTRKS